MCNVEMQRSQCCVLIRIWAVRNCLEGQFVVRSFVRGLLGSQKYFQHGCSVF